MRNMLLAGTGFAIFYWAMHTQAQVWSSADDLNRSIRAGRISEQDALDTYYALQKRAWFPAMQLGAARAALVKKLIDDGSEPIADYRRESPTAREGDWKRAEESFRKAIQLDPNNGLAESGLLVCEAHVDRIEGHSPSGKRTPASDRLLNQAIALFNKAADRNKQSFDPYLGLARIYFADEHDYNRGLEMLNEASKNGYRVGPREKAEEADCLRDRAMRAVTQAASLSDLPDRQRQMLEGARADFGAAAELYSSLLGFTPDVERLLRDTLARKQKVEMQLAGDGPVASR
jgi:tetratricopeptide (TPR) repeat protein